MPDFSSKIPVLKMPSGIKKAPTVMPTSTRNLKNQKLGRKKSRHSISYNVQYNVQCFPTVYIIYWRCSPHVWPAEFSMLLSYRSCCALYEPILYGGSRVLAAAHTDHDDGEEEEEAGHGEAHSVH